MNVKDKQESFSFDCDFLPLPVVIHQKGSGRILKLNRAAEKKFHIKKNEKRSWNIEHIQIGRTAVTKSSIKGFSDCGQILYRTLKGKEIKFHVLRKSMSWMGKKCFIDFLEESADLSSVKSEIIKSSIDAFVSIDKNQTILDWNSAAEKIFGWKRSEVIGKSLVNAIVPASYRKQHRQGLKHYLSTGEGTILNKLIEITALHKKGHEFPIELTVTPVRENGNLLFYSFIRDISERKKREEQIIESELRLKRAQSIASVGSWEMSGRFQETYWSDQFYLLHGLKPQSVKPSTKLRLSMVHPLDRTKLQSAIDQAVKEGKPYSIEKRIILPNKEIRWILSQGEATINPITGKRKVFGTLLDITHRKKAEESILKSSSYLSETLIFGKMGSAELNLVTLQLTISKELFQLLEVEKPQANQLPLQKFIETFVHPDYLETIRQKISEGINGVQDKRTVVEVDFEMITASGKRIWIEAKGIFKCGSAFGLFQDVTKKRQNENEIFTNSRLINRILIGITDGFFATDRDLNFTLVNPVFAKQVQRKPEEMIGKNMLQLFPTMEGGELVNFYRETMYSMKSSTVEHRSAVDPNQFFEINVYPNPQGIFVYYKDISFSKKAENKLLSANKLFSRLSENVPGMIYNFYLTDEGKAMFPYVSSGSEHLLGIPPGALERDASLVFKRIHPEDFQLVIQSMKDAFYMDKPWAAEFRMVMSDQSIKWISGFSNSYKENDGSIYWYGFMHDVTSRKLADQHIAESELKNRLIIENSGEGIVFTEPKNGIIVSANPEACRIFGMTEEEVCKMKASDFLDLADPDLASKFKIQENETSYQGELKMKRKDGTIFIAELSAKLFTSPNDKLNASIIIRNISDRKKAEHVREELLSQFRKISAHVPGTIYQYRLRKDGTSHFPYASEGILNIYGVHPSEVIDDAAKVFAVLHPDDISYVRSSIQHSAQTLTKWHDEYRVNLPSGKNIWVEGNASPQANDDGSIIWYGYITDITSRKEAEQQIKESEERFKRLYNQTPAMMHSLDTNGKLISVSDYWIEKMGYEREEVIGKRSIDFLSPESKEKAIKKYIPEFLKNKKLLNAEYQFVTKSGKIIDTLMSATGETDQNGHVKNSMAVITDITEKKQLEKENNRLAMVASRTSNAVIFTDKEGYITWVNKGFEKITEYKLEEVMWEKPGSLLQGPETSKESIAILQQAIRDGQYVRSEILNYSKSGRKYWLDIEIIPIKNEQGKLNGFMAIESDITQLKLVVNEMLNSETRLQTMMDHAPLVVFMKDLEGRYIFFNKSYHKTISHLSLKSSFTDKDFLDNPLADLLIGRDQQIMETNESLNYELELNGHQYLETKFPILDQRGKIYAIGGIAIDITDKKKLEQAIQESEERFRTIAQNIPKGAIYQFKLTPDGEYSFPFITEGIYSILGIRSNEIIFDKKKLIKLAHPDDTGPFQKAVEKSASELSEFHNTSRFKDVNGNYRWLTAHSKPKRMPDGSTIWEGVLLDDTDKKRAKEEIEKANERFSIVATATNDIIWDWNLITNELWWNDNFFNFLGFDRATTATDISLWKSFVHPEDISYVMDSIYGVINRGEKFWSAEYRFFKNDGSIVFIYDRGFVLKDKDGNPYRMIGSMQDITARKKAQLELQKVYDELNAILNATNDSTFFIDDQFRVRVYNKIAGESIRAIFGRAIREGDNMLDFVPAILQEDFKNNFMRALHGEKISLEREVPFTKNFSEWRQISYIPVRDNHGLIIGVSFNTTDISLRKQAEMELVKANRLYAVTSSINQMVARAKTQNEIFSEACKIAVREGKFRMVWIGWIDRKQNKIKPIASDGFVDNYFDNVPAISILDNPNGRGPSGQAAREARTVVNSDIADKTNTNFNLWREQAMLRGYGSSIGLPIIVQGEVIAIFTLYHSEANFFTDKEIQLLEEVTSNIAFGFTSIENEKIRLEKEEQVRKLANNIPRGAIYQYQKTRDNIVSYNFFSQGIESITGIKQEEILNNPNAILSLVHPEDQLEMLKAEEDSQQRLAPFSHEFRQGTIWGDYKWMHASSNPHKRKDGTVVWDGVILDITEKKKSEEDLLKSNKEKDLLIKEIHHRVKNNLQLISSIIYIKMKSMPDGEFKNFLDDTRQKIRSISLIHERLLQTNSVNQVNLLDYLGKLINDLQMTSSTSDSDISIKSSIDSVNMNLDVAIYCGLIINELVTNSIKHAFKERSGGKIQIDLHRLGEGFQLTVSDDGISIPENLLSNTTGRFGLQMLEIFVTQLKGKMEVNRTNGTTFTITF